MLTDGQIIDELRRALAAETDQIDPRPGLLGRVHHELAATPARERGARRLRLRGDVVITTVAAGVAIAIAAVALVVLHHNNIANPVPVMNRVAVGTARIAVSAPDPNGGASWALRTVQTGRRQACLQIGRLEHGEIGTLGQDGAYADDGRFHSIPLHDSFPCAGTDVNNNLFLNVLEGDVPADGDAGGGHGGCAANTCPSHELRNIAFGVLGPDAVSVTYSLHGHTITEPTGPDGAYIAVVPGTTRLCRVERFGESCFGGGGEQTTGTLQSGLITSVQYSNGRVCRLAVAGPLGSRRPTNVVSASGTGTVPQVVTAPYLGTPAGAVASSCPAVGYTPTPYYIPHVTAAQVATPMSVRTYTAKRYCIKPLAFGSYEIPCDHGVPHGYQPAPPGESPRIALVDISFTARLAADNHHSVYEFSYGRASGPANCTLNTGGTDATTMLPIHAGQRVTIQDEEEVCPGTYTGLVTYQPNGGPGQDTLDSSSPIRDHSILVGRFKYVLR